MGDKQRQTQHYYGRRSATDFMGYVSMNPPASYFLSLMRIAVIQHLVAAIFRSQRDLAMTSWYVMSYGHSLSAQIKGHCIA